jgi:hypothetical protein
MSDLARIVSISWPRLGFVLHWVSSLGRAARLIVNWWILRGMM